MTDGCFWHPDEERGQAFRICRECGHRYASAWDLRDAYEDALGQRVAADDITYCPLCAHDF